MEVTVTGQYVNRNVGVTKNVTKQGFIFYHDQPYHYFITHTKNINKIKKCHLTIHIIYYKVLILYTATGHTATVFQSEK